MAQKLLAIVLLALAGSACVHLPPPVKAEMERSAEPADNNFARASAGPPPASQSPASQSPASHATR
jgi:hypothetical protein